MAMYLNPEDSSSDSDDESVAEEQTQQEKTIPGFSLALAHHWSHTSEPPMAARFLADPRATNAFNLRARAKGLHVNKGRGARKCSACTCFLKSAFLKKTLIIALKVL